MTVISNCFPLTLTPTPAPTASIVCRFLKKRPKEGQLCHARHPCFPETDRGGGASWLSGPDPRAAGSHRRPLFAEQRRAGGHSGQDRSGPPRCLGRCHLQNDRLRAPVDRRHGGGGDVHRRRFPLACLLCLDALPDGRRPGILDPLHPARPGWVDRPWRSGDPPPPTRRPGDRR